MRRRSIVKPLVLLIVGSMLMIGVFVGAFAFHTFNGNRTLIDTKFYYDYAIVQLADGSVIKGKVDNWLDYEGEQIQVTINGETWLVHSANLSLCAR
jgi:hypothetical protein